MHDLTISEWRDRASDACGNDPLLARGDWHGYINGADDGPMVGAYMLVRWVTPSIALSDDDPDELIVLARAVEATLKPVPTNHPKEIKWRPS